MVLRVCVGSSCHLKGSYDVIEAFKALIDEYEVRDKIELKASFCLNNCMNGVTVKADEMLIHKANAGNAREIFVNEILPRLAE